MRVAMFSWESMHSIAIGGLAPHVTELSAALARLGHEVHVFTRIGDGQRGYDFIDGVHYHRCPFAGHEDFHVYVQRMCDSFVWHMVETESYVGRAFDLVHGHDWLAVHAMRQAKNRHHRPLVMTVHSTEYGRCGNSYWDDPTSKHIRDLEWEGTYLADRLITVSKTLGREVNRCYAVPLDKIYAIYNGVNVAKYDGDVDVRKVRKTFDVGADDPMVLFAGRMTWQKGPDLLLESIPGVLAERDDAAIVFAGDGDMRPGLERRVRAMGLSDQVRFVGHRAGGELVGIFKSADVVCVPSRNEPFGIVILEAWSASKPVVATKIGGPIEFVQDEYSGLTVDLGIEPIGDGVRRLLADEQEAKKMGRNGRREAESRFSWDHAASATAAVYRTVLGGRASGNGATPKPLTEV